MYTKKLTHQQIKAIDNVKHNRISILTGGPGSGKTFTLSHILSWAISKNLNFAQAAFTGKASKRMMESTGHNASTIHSLLGCQFNGDGFKFIHDEKNQFNLDLIILDECSMIPMPLFTSLLKAINPLKTKLLLVGDDDQLKSVGIGAILRDMIASGLVPVTVLDIIHRNSGKIVQNCAKIKNGEKYTPDKKIDLQLHLPGKERNPINHIHLEISTPDKILAGIEKLIMEVIPKKYENYDTTWDIQTISPMNKRGKLSCDSINRVLQQRLNPNAEKPKEDGPLIFYTGDKIIQTKNNNSVSCVGNGSTFVVNGDMGTILYVDSKNYIIRFLDPDREVLIPKYNHNLLHAYAITCHRFQGSECRVIIIPVHTSMSFFCTRKWVYTAVSRAQDICVTIGQFAAINQMISNVREVERVTRLKEEILEVMAMNNEVLEVEI